MEKSQDLLGIYLANCMTVVITINSTLRVFTGGVHLILTLGGLVYLIEAFDQDQYQEISREYKIHYYDECFWKYLIL